MPRIAYFGPSGTFTEMALDRFERSGAIASVAALGAGPVERIAAPSQPAALDLVRTGAADAAVVPFESSVDGSVAPTMDSLADGDRLQIVAENELDVAFTIATRPGIAADDVRTIGAYPIAHAQVRRWIESTLPHATVAPSSSNAAAAEDVASGIVDAGVSTALAARRLGLTALADGVADFDGARTRFVLVVRPTPVPARTGHDRTSVVFSLPSEPGTLGRALDEFGSRGVDLTRIESRPTRREFGTYVFHVDCVGHLDDPLVAESLRALHRLAERVRFLGSWPTEADQGRLPTADDEAQRWEAALRRGDPVP